MIRSRQLFMPVLALALVAACQEAPTDSSAGLGPSLAKGGKPTDCGFTPLSITFGDAVGNALRSDGGGAYVEGTDGGAHLNSATGRLMLWTRQNGTPTRVVNYTTSDAGGSTSDRIYTNTHSNDAGCGFKDMANGSIGTAVLEAELNASDNDPYDVVRYGKNCGGSVVAGTKVVTTRSADGLSWTITGTSGVHCKQLGRKPSVLTQVGTAGAFSMTLVDISSP